MKVLRLYHLIFLFFLSAPLLMSQQLESPASTNEPCANGTFDVASIRPSSPQITSGVGRPSAIGEVNETGTTVLDLIEEAYHLRKFQISGIPEWASTVRFDVAAKSLVPLL
jgi:hypothetical protein